MSSLLLNCTSVKRTKKAKIGNSGEKVCIDDARWKLTTVVLTSDTILIAENYRDLQNVMNSVMFTEGS